jgi:hypothetical protein
MNRLKKRIAVIVLGAAIGVVQLAGPAEASRADGVCGGVGVYDPVTQQCQ